MPNELAKASANGVHVVAYRGEGNCLLAMDVDATLRTDDFVGFSLEVKYPGGNKYYAVTNRLSFDYPPDQTGKRSFSTLDAPLQKFRWVHFPSEVRDGDFTYRVTPAYMDAAGKVTHKPGVEVAVNLSAVSVPGLVNIGFTRGFVSSQAYVNRFKNNPKILPPPLPIGTVGCAELPFDMTPFAAEYDWLGFEARRLIMQFLADCVADSTITVDFLAYELKEPMVLAQLEQLGARLRAIIDDSVDNRDPATCESTGAVRLQNSAGASQVKRMHFGNLQHNKVLIARRNGKPFRVLAGSTNFTLRGIYIQANNLLDFSHDGVTGLYGQVFDAYWTSAVHFRQNALAKAWHEVTVDADSQVALCFAPHSDADTSLARVADAIRNAQSSVLFAVAFLYQSSGPVRDALDAAVASELFTYGTSDSPGSLKLQKPDGTYAIVPFTYLDTHVPPPFQGEWSGGSGRHMHHKFVVCDFNGTNPVVFTGSSNLSPSGEEGNGDNLIMIANRSVVTAYAIEAVRLFDHYEFRAAMHAVDQGTTPEPLLLKKPPAAGQPTWFASAITAGTAKAKDRELFMRPIAAP